jgi:hypothetical protein
MPMRQEVRPSIDIAGSIGGLGDALQQGMEFGQKRKIDRATRAALASGLTTGPDGLPDYMTAAGNILAGGGDTETALTLARLAEAQNERQWQHNQPHYMDIGGNLYDTNSPAFRQAATGRQSPAQPQSDPADFGNQQPPDQTDYQPPAPDQPVPEQTAQVEPQPIIRGQPKPRQRRRGLNAEGQEVEQEVDENGNWVEISGPKAAEPKPPTEDQLKNRQLLSVVSPQLTILDTTFADLAKPENQVGAGFTPDRYQNYAVTPGYQRGRDALRTIISSYLYSVSGATANPGEVETQTDILMPKLGEDATTTADKKARVQLMVDAIRIRAGETTGVESAGSSDQPAPQQQAQPPPSNKPPVPGAIWSPDDGRWFIIGPDGQPDWVQ